jgi:hypothetical protein
LPKLSAANEKMDFFFVYLASVKQILAMAEDKSTNRL